MVILVTIPEPNPRTGVVENIVNYAYDRDTGKRIVVPADTPENLGAKFDREHGWILPKQS